MKTIIFLLILISLSHVHAQDFTVIRKVNKHVSIIAPRDTEDKLPMVLYGLSYDNEVKVPMIYNEIEVTSNMILLYTIRPERERVLLMGGANMNGDIVVPVEYDVIDDNYSGTYSLQKNELVGVYSDEWAMIVPVEYSNVSIYHELILAQKESGWALYHTDGTVLEPFGPHLIEIVDEYEEAYAVVENEQSVLHFNENMYILDGYNQVSRSLFAKTTEVSIREYFAFLADLSWMQTHGDEYNRNLNPEDFIPDTNFVEPKLRPIYRNFLQQFAIDESSAILEYELSMRKRNSYSISIPLKKDKTIEALLDFPVTGVTRTQAEQYTQWLSDVYNSNFNNFDYDHLVNFRLPTESEWISLAEDGLSEEMRANHVLDSVNAETCMLFIYKNLDNCKTFDNYMEFSFGGGSVKTVTLNPDWNGLYQVFGNVAEFTSEAGINKGGSFDQTASESKTGNVQNGEGPQPWLGFRVVADRIK